MDGMHKFKCGYKQNKTNCTHTCIASCAIQSIFSLAAKRVSGERGRLGWEHVEIDPIKLPSQMSDCAKPKIIMWGHAQQQKHTKQKGGFI